MNKTSVIGFSAWSGTGKTTLIEGLIPELRALGLHTAVVKHDVHGLILDEAGKDSSRFAEAGADTVLACCGGTVLLREARPRGLKDLLSLIREADLILVEGFKSEPIPQVGLYRTGSGKGLPEPADHYVAVVTDDPGFRAGVPVFTFDQKRELAHFLAEHRREYRLPLLGE